MRLSYGQMWAILFTMRSCVFMYSNTDYSINRMAGIAISIFIQFIISFPIVRKYENNNISSKIKSGGAVIAIFYFIFAGIILLYNLLKIFETGTFSSPESIISMLLFIVTVLYCSKLGIKATGRAAVISAGLFIFFIILLFITSIDEMHFEYILKVNDKNILYYTLRDIMDSVEFPAALILPFFVYEGRKKSLYIYLGTKFIFSEAIVIFGASLLGKVSSISYFPFFEMCSFSDPLGVQRSDALFISLCTLASVVYISVCFVMSETFVKKYIIKFKQKKEK